MKKSENGFFLAETIIVLALVTTIMAFVFPNVSKLYDNYKTRIKYYDQTEDILLLKAIYEDYENQKIIQNQTTAKCGDIDMIGSKKITNLNSADSRIMDLTKNPKVQLIENLPADTDLKKLYIASYTEHPTSSYYSFNRYLKRIRITNNDKTAYRLIGFFKDSKNIERYASIKIVMPESCGINFD